MRKRHDKHGRIFLIDKHLNEDKEQFTGQRRIEARYFLLRNMGKT